MCAKVVLVTGGATGIGKAIVKELAKEGYDIALHYYSSEQSAKEIQKEISIYGIRSILVQCDVADEGQVDRMFTKIEEELGGVDILVNNAGIDMPSLFQQKTADEFRRVLDVNVIGAFNCAKRARMHMKKQEYGRIINIASTNGINTYYPVNIDYDASKAAMISLTHNLAVQCAPEITVNAIAPGFIGTRHELEGYEPEFLEEECSKILVRRYGEPEEVAYLVKFLISAQANFINNSVIRIDGGQLGSC